MTSSNDVVLRAIGARVAYNSDEHNQVEAYEMSHFKLRSPETIGNARSDHRSENARDMLSVIGLAR